MVIAPLDDVTISRRHLEVKPVADGKFQLTNKSANQVVGLANSELQPGATCDITLPAVIRLGKKTLRSQVLESVTEEALASLPMATMAPGADFAGLMKTVIAKVDGPSMGADQLNAWVHAGQAGFPRGRYRSGKCPEQLARLYRADLNYFLRSFPARAMIVMSHWVFSDRLSVAWLKSNNRSAVRGSCPRRREKYV